jgi:ankyrin repeat protein
MLAASMAARGGRGPERVRPDNHDGRTTLLAACQASQFHVVELLLDAGAMPADGHRSTLASQVFQTVGRDEQHLVRRLVDAGTEVYSSKHGFVDAVR